MTDHPITPPPELVRQWMYESNDSDRIIPQVAAFAAQWGADQELEACCEWVGKVAIVQIANNLRTARRPKPPSLKEQAQAELDRLIALIPAEGAMAMAEPIRKALEQLND